MLNNFSPGTAKGLFGGTNDKEALKKMRTFLGSEQFFQVWSQYIVALSVAELGMPPLAEEELKAAIAQDVEDARAALR